MKTDILHGATPNKFPMPDPKEQALYKEFKSVLDELRTKYGYSWLKLAKSTSAGNVDALKGRYRTGYKLLRTDVENLKWDLELERIRNKYKDLSPEMRDALLTIINNAPDLDS